MLNVNSKCQEYWMTRWADHLHLCGGKSDHKGKHKCDVKGCGEIKHD